MTEAHAKRHLAFAFVEFIERQMADGDEFDSDKLKEARDSIRSAFNLPDDNSLKVSSREYSLSSFNSLGPCVSIRENSLTL